MAPGCPAANGEVQLESEVNNPVWEKTREFQREKERKRKANRSSTWRRSMVKESEIARDPPTDPVLKCTSRIRVQIEINSSEGGMWEN